ncbi:hypothetical protein [Campylobacter sp. RM16188]|uniref:hypothetical protein n=1 Tax=Campylobacter sp. RM16188 TaxID=1705725 RepID=UPI00155261F8|nr:hypothetical protein [Campylobacter sp. RM16188]
MNRDKFVSRITKKETDLMSETPLSSSLKSNKNAGLFRRQILDVFRRMDAMLPEEKERFVRAVAGYGGVSINFINIINSNNSHSLNSGCVSVGGENSGDITNIKGGNNQMGDSNTQNIADRSV